MSHVEEKVWGTVQHIFDGPVATSLLRVSNYGTCCSVHEHKRRDNLFHVVSGSLLIHIFEWTDAQTIRYAYSRRLLQDQNWTAQPGLLHCFEVVQEAQVVEIYKTFDGSPAKESDIIRYQEGGRADEILLGFGYRCPHL